MVPPTVPNGDERRKRIVLIAVLVVLAFLAAALVFGPQ